MIVQGSNNPIIVSFDEDVSSIQDWSMSLYGEDKRGAPGDLLKHWGLDDVEIDENSVSAPLSQEETLAFPPCVATLEIKWLNADDLIFHSKKVRIRIDGRNDSTHLMTSDQS